MQQAGILFCAQLQTSVIHMIVSAFICRWNSIEIYPKTGIAINAISLISTARRTKQVLITNVTMTRKKRFVTLTRTHPSPERDVLYGGPLIKVKKFIRMHRIN